MSRMENVTLQNTPACETQQTQWFKNIKQATHVYQKNNSQSGTSSRPQIKIKEETALNVRN